MKPPVRPVNVTALGPNSDHAVESQATRRADPWPKSGRESCDDTDQRAALETNPTNGAAVSMTQAGVVAALRGPTSDQNGENAPKPDPPGSEAQRRPEGVAPKGGWQQPHPGLTECTRHRNLCAYRQGAPDRCDGCHALWDAITRTWQDAGARADHLAEHARDDEIAAKGVARMRAKRATR